MILTNGQRTVISWSGFLAACTAILAFAELRGDDERRREQLHRQELEAAAKAGAIAATIVNAVVDDREAFDASDVLEAHGVEVAP